MSIRIIGQSVWNNPGNRGMRVRKLFAALRWQLYKRVVKRPKVITLANGARFRAYPDCVISSALLYADWPEFRELRFCRQYLRPGHIVVDVGANVGHFSLLLADVVLPQDIYCFEPTPVTWRRLRDNFELNEWPVAKLHQAAVGRVEGTLEFPDTKSPETINSAAWSRPGVKLCKVPVVSLDAFVLELADRPVGLLKIDVEGFEREVFLGARSFLKVCRPKLIMFESLSGQLDQEIGDVLRDDGYIIFQLDARGQPIRNPLDAQNLFAAPLELRTSF